MNKQAAKYKISPKGKRKLDYPTKSSKSHAKLPLIGKTIYLDVKDTKHLKRLQQDLKKLGATLEEFVSRDINYLITSQPRPRNKVASPCGDENPSPSPFNCDPSPSPGYPEDKKVTSVTRGKALLQKARYSRQTSTLLDNAEKWGVKIVSIEGAFKWIDRELKKLPKSAGNQSKRNNRTKCVSSYKLIKAPYVKLEGKTFCYRPFHLELDVWPRLNVDTPRGSCPFDGTQIKGGDESREERGELLAAQVDIPSEDTPKEEKDGSESAASTPKPLADKTGKKSESDVFVGSRVMTAGELKRRRELKRKQERKRGYCECCHVKYEDLDKHVKEDQHRQYVKNKSNYQPLDTLITSGRNTQNFLFEYLAKAAHMTSVRINNRSLLNNKVSEDNIRRSPRKSVQDMTVKSLIKSPRKTLQQPTLQSVRSPKRLVETLEHNVRVSPRKNLKLTSDEKRALPRVNIQKLTFDEIPQPKTPVTNAGLTKLPPTSRTRKNSESKKKDLDKCQNISDNMNEVRKDLGEKCARSLNKSPVKTLSPVNVCKIMHSKSPMKKESSPRKQLTRSIVQEDGKNATEVLNKENVSPVKQRVDKAVDQKPSNLENKRKLENRNDKTETEGNYEINTCHNRKYMEKSICPEKIVKEDLVCSFNEEPEISCDKSIDLFVGHTETEVSTCVNQMDYELTKAGFIEIVNYARTRSLVEHSSDDFEVCFARSLENDSLPELKNPAGEIAEKTFDGMVVQCEKVGVTDKSSDTFSVHKACLTENEINESISKIRKSPRKKHKGMPLLNKTGFSRRSPFEQSEKKTYMENESKNAENEKDVFDIDEESDIPSDFQCYDKRGKLLTFSKTLAERIKERSVGRRSSVESYNVNVLFQIPSRSRSNSFSSNHSDKTSKTAAKIKPKNSIKMTERKKSGSSIASAKVVNKYRNRRTACKPDENNQIGYQGDDENEQTPRSDNLKHTRFCQTKRKFWHYVPIVEKTEKTACDAELKGLPKELRELKTGNAWFSSDNSDSEPRKARMQVKMNFDSTDLKKKSLNNRDKKVIRDTVLQSEEIEAFNEPNDTKEIKKDSSKNPNCENRNEDRDFKLTDGCLKNIGKESCKKKKKFWYYITEHKESDSEKDNETDVNLPRELRELRNSSTNFVIEPESRRSRKMKGRINEDSRRASQSENEKLQAVNKEKKLCNEKETSLANKGKNIRDLEKSGNASEKIEAKSRKNIKKLGYFVEEIVANSEEEKLYLKNLPKELRLLKDAWTSNQVLNKNDRRKSRTLVGYADTEKSSSGEDLDQNIQEASYQGYSNPRTTVKSSLASKSNETKNTKEKTCKRYWDIVEVEEGSDEENERNLPKELRYLKFSKSDIFGSEASDIEKRLRVRDKKFGIRSHVRQRESTVNDDYTNISLRRRESKVNYRESDNTETDENESDSEDNGVRVKNKRTGRNRELRGCKQKSVNYTESTETDTETDSCNEDHKADNSLKNQSESKQHRYVSISEDCFVKNTGKLKIEKGSINGVGHTDMKTKRGRSKYWDYLTEAVDDISDKSEYANLPKELRLLKETCFWSSDNDADRRSRSSSRKGYEESVSPETLISKKKVETIECFESKVNQTVDFNRVTSVQGDANKADIVVDCENWANSHETDKTEHSDNERSRPRSRKHKVFWEYQYLPDEDAVTVDKSLPKELQQLRDAWNDFSAVRGRRSCQSRSDVENRNNTTSETKKMAVQQKDNDEDEEVVLIDEEVSVTAKSKACGMTEKKQAANSKNSDTCKPLLENNDLFSNTGSEQKDLGLSYDEMSDQEGNARSTSPVFNVIQNSQHRTERRKSPVFYRSPRQFAETYGNKKRSVGHSKTANEFQNKKYTAKGKSIQRNIGSKINSKTNREHTVDVERGGSGSRHTGDYCSDSEEEVDKVDKGNLVNESSFVLPQTIKTPEKSEPALEPGSGYSNTPREKRRKQWKRKNVEIDSPFQDGKKRKLEDAHIVDDSRTTLVTNSQNKDTPRRRLLEPNGNDVTENTKNTAQPDSYLTKERTERTEHAGHENTENKFALSWKPVSSEIGEKKYEKVKLNRSWTMLSERSISKLLSSENENENFDGFTDEDTLPSDMSYEEQSDVEIPKDGEHEWVLEDAENEENEENLEQYVPAFFPSPNKTSNSSWNDAIEGYIDNSVNQGPESSFRADRSSYFSFNCSPRKSPLKQSCQSPFKMAGVRKSSKLQSPVKVYRPSTPKRKKETQMHSPEIKRVDDEIEFNFGSPQKNRSNFSPLKTVKGVVKNLSLTSTPASKNFKRQRHRKY